MAPDNERYFLAAKVRPLIVKTIIDNGKIINDDNDTLKGHKMG
jgi:hypothetical protein